MNIYNPYRGIKLRERETLHVDHHQYSMAAGQGLVCGFKMAMLPKYDILKQKHKFLRGVSHTTT